MSFFNNERDASGSWGSCEGSCDNSCEGGCENGIMTLFREGTCFLVISNGCPNLF